MTEATLSEKLSRHHIDLQLDEVPPSVVEAAKLHILDSLGCLLAGSRLEPGKLAYDLAAASSAFRFYFNLAWNRFAGFIFRRRPGDVRRGPLRRNG